MDYKTVVRKMAREEKFRFLTGAGMNKSLGFPQYGVSAMHYHDGPFGLRMKVSDLEEDQENIGRIRSAFPNSTGGEEVVSAAFPTGAALGASWDPELLYEVGQALGEECRMYGVHALMGPAMSLKRHPLCGRNFEYFSEDPVLTEKLAEAYVRGIQEEGVAACPKHFALNNQERGRFHLSSEADERTMREVYLKAFEGVVKNASPWSIMCSYNRINGVFASENGWLLDEVLRKEWGFDGIVISDWGSVKNRALSLLASVEMCMPYQEEAYGQLKEAYEKGLINDEIVDEAVERLLAFYERTNKEKGKLCDMQKHHELALRAARESIVLLKNEGRILPLDRKKWKKVLVLGETAANPYIGGDGSSRVANPYCIQSPLAELKKRLGDEVSVEYLGDEALRTYQNEIGIMEGRVARLASEADLAVIFAAQDYSCSSETMDRDTIDLPPYMEHAIRVCHRTGHPVIVVLNIGSSVSTRKWRNCADAILVSWMGGQAMGQAVAETLLGENNPSGKLAETFPERLQDAPGMDGYPGDGYKTVYREGILAGYSHYDAHGIQPDYEFGFGLSYASFAYENIRYDAEEGLSFEVTNLSERPGDEIAQVYLEFPENSWVSHPPRELKAFRRVSLEGGEKKTVKIPLPEEVFTYYNLSLKRWVAENGTYYIRVGASSRNLPLSIPVKKTGYSLISSENYEE